MTGSRTPTIIAIAGLAAICVVAIIVLGAYDRDLLVVSGLIAAILVPTTAALLSYAKADSAAATVSQVSQDVRVLKVEVDGKMDRIVELASRAAAAEATVVAQVGERERVLLVPTVPFLPLVPTSEVTPAQLGAAEETVQAAVETVDAAVKTVNAAATPPKPPGGQP